MQTTLTTRRVAQMWNMMRRWFVNTFATKKDLESINIDTTELAKQGTSAEATNTAILEAVGSIDIDTTELAKQGSNAEATLTAIYEALKGSEEPSPDIPEGVAERLALILEFFGIKTLDGYEFMTEQEVYDELEVIMTTMDGDLTAEDAASITEETISLVGT